MTTLTPEAKALLSSTIRALRARLLQDIRDEADRSYRLSVPLAQAGLDEAHAKRRKRLEAWLDERVRATKPKAKKDETAARERLLGQCEKEAAATLLNRIVLVRHIEAAGLSKPQIVTEGWNSKGYREFREFAPALTGDETEGFATLLQYLFDELAVDLPGLFGDVGLTRLFPVPAATLREVVERLDDDALKSAWTDDTTLGWVYQYWNDPEREALDAKIADGGKIEPHEIASKTQMFTERYMVEWLLHNSLGLTWLCICKKNGWTPDAEAVLPALDARRAQWRTKREAGEVALDALMPIESELEDRWKYYVPQPIPDDAVDKAPDSIRTLKLLDPACGSGHFLVIAFDLLAPLYREEARHRGQEITDTEIAESILANNLHGVDIDPRAIQIAAAGLYLKAKTLSPTARPHQVNLVAPTLQLGSLPDDDPSLVRLRGDLKREAGIPEDLSRKLVSALAGVDHLGTLLKVDSAVEDALRAAELEIERGLPGQGDLFGGFPAERVKLSVGEAKSAVLGKLEGFLARHSTSEDLGLRLDGEQLAAGVRFVRIVREGTFDVVVGNPPYHGVGKLRESGYYVSKYSEARPDLFAGFYLRGLELAREGGVCALITLSNWMYLSVFAEFRRAVRKHSLVALADLGKAAFTTGGTLISTSSAVLRRGTQMVGSVAVRPHAPDEVVRDDGQPGRTEAALLLQRGRYEFDPKGFEVIEAEPIVYWWSKEFLGRYAGAPTLGKVSPARFGVTTGNNARFLRQHWELTPRDVLVVRHPSATRNEIACWVPFVMGAAGRVWFEPLSDVGRWDKDGLELRVFCETSPGASIRNPACFYRYGVAFSMIGNQFSARAHRYVSIFGNKGSSVFPESAASVIDAVCLMNSTRARFVLQSLNPGIGFEVGDVNRLPMFSFCDGADVFGRVQEAFGSHEVCREPSVEFKRPGPSPWRYAQDWAQRAVDRPDGEPLPPYKPEHDPPTPESFVSFAVGVALGRFGGDGEGILDAVPPSALAAGILFLSAEGHDSLDHPACKPLQDAWKEHGPTIGGGDDLRTYLRKSFFDYHKKLYENRPIYFPLSSAKKSFVAYVSIHRWRDDSLQVLLADYLMPERRRLEGELEDLRKARAEKASKGKAEKRFAEAQKLLEELNDFIAKVTEVADKGPPQSDDKTTKREHDARYVMDLDDGVMVNSAALWPLLEPQWKDPKKWWKELATAKGRKDYDWSHLAARYFPTRVEQKCHQDPSLGVAHKCFCRLHPAKAYAWELRLQDEIRPDFTIDEPGSDEYRARFLAEHPRDAEDLRAAEMKRRERKANKQTDELELPGIGAVDEEEGDSDG